MKISVDKKEEVFNPITLSLTITSKEEFDAIRNLGDNLIETHIESDLGVSNRIFLVGLVEDLASALEDGGY